MKKITPEKVLARLRKAIDNSDGHDIKDTHLEDLFREEIKAAFKLVLVDDKSPPPSRLVGQAAIELGFMWEFLEVAKDELYDWAEQLQKEETADKK